VSAPPRLNLKELRGIVQDPDELGKGTRIHDEGGLTHLSRFEHKLFADAKGSGSAPYKVQIHFQEDGVRGRCSCMAARSRPFCKHASALLVAWSRAPESFAEAEAPPVAPGETSKKKRVKTGKVDPKERIARGVDQVGTLVRELAVAGVASLASDRVAQVRALGASLRDANLRRLSARTLELSSHLQQAAARSGGFDASEYADLLSDMLLTARKLEQHLGGEPIASEHVEELIGKTWTKKDRVPIADLHLVEYGFVTRTTSDDFVIRESRFLDLSSGGHFSEKQILPRFLAKRSAPKASHGGKLLAGAAGSLYPTFAPRRVEIADPGSVSVLKRDSLERLVERSIPTVASLLEDLAERCKDVFAPPMVPVALRVEAVAAEGSRLKALDGSEEALYLPDGGEAAEVLAQTLNGSRLRVLLGDAALDGAFPTLFPMAAVVETDGDLELVPLTQRDAAAILDSKKVRATTERLERGRSQKWVEVARQLGVSGAAVALGEVREEMAEALANGLLTVVPRITEPLASRLVELSLSKQAELLKAVGERSDPADKLDDFVKLRRVLGIALSRLAGAARVERSGFESVPGYPSVLVPRSERPMEPAEVVARVSSGAMNRYEAAVSYSRYYDSIPPETLASSIYPTWADGSATPHVVAVLVKAPEIAVDACRRVLQPKAKGSDRMPWQHRTTARMAKLTAIRLLGALTTQEARALLLDCVERRKEDPALRAHAARALGRSSGAGGGDLERLTHWVLNGSTAEDRARALKALAANGHVEAIPVIRASFLGDITRSVREEAAQALALLGDIESVETFVRILRERASRPDEAKVAARALGILGDVRGLDELLKAWAEGWNPGILSQCLHDIGPAALDSMVRFVEHDRELVRRKAALSVVAALPAEEVIELIANRLEARRDDDDFAEWAGLYLSLLAEHREAAPATAKRILRLWPSLADGGKPTKAEKMLRQKCEKHLAGAGPAPSPEAPAPKEDESAPKGRSFWSTLLGRK
jgi:hypothetical protein